jgi:UDP-N-acetylmuramyl pentapeptide phosphotransferase/UDP-N-acetylglucosamine-1-phosphate transferase
VGLYLLLVLVSVFVTFVGCYGFVLTKKWHGALSMDHMDGIQKFHTDPTPRVGGVPIAMGLFVSMFFVSRESFDVLSMTLIASLPAFVFGLTEDLTKRVGVLVRLGATMASGILAWWMTDYSLTRLDLVWIDRLLQSVLISVLFTAFAVGGVANALNIVDGFNGLAGVTAFMVFLGYAYIAWQVGDMALFQVALVFAGVAIGFLGLNWPLGKIFLGDGGAYLLGFSMAWFAVLLVQRHGNVSAFSALVLCSHPINEVLFSVYRRKIKKTHPGMPDRLHFHSLFHRRYMSRWLATRPHWLRNSASGMAVAGFSLVSLMVVCFTYKSTRLSILGYMFLASLYVVLYLRMIKHRWAIY